jgi:hypothetical protein
MNLRLQNLNVLLCKTCQKLVRQVRSGTQTFEERDCAARDDTVYRKSELRISRKKLATENAVRDRTQTFMYILIGTFSAFLAFPSMANRVTIFNLCV